MAGASGGTSLGTFYVGDPDSQSGDKRSGSFVHRVGMVFQVCVQKGNRFQIVAECLEERDAEMLVQTKLDHARMFEGGSIILDEMEWSPCSREQAMDRIDRDAAVQELKLR